MDVVAEGPAYVSLLLLHYLVSATLLATTPKHSRLRYLALPCLYWTISQVVKPVISTTPTRCNVIALFGISAAQAVRLLLIEPRDDKDLAEKLAESSPSFPSRLWRAIRMLWGTRAVNTSWQVKNIPSHPAYFTRRGMHVPPRGRFLLRQCFIFIWQYLVLDIFHTLRVQQLSEQGEYTGFTELQWAVPIDQWIERIISNLVTWFIIGRLVLDSHYRFLSFVCVGLDLNSPAEWPPAFGRMADAYTLRNYWGKFWHQFLRQPFTAVSSFLTRDVLGLPRPSLLERYTNIFLVFLLSGILHVMIDYGQCVPVHYSGSLHYFLSFVCGIMIEDGAQSLFRYMCLSKPSSTKQDDGTLLWRRVVGWIWIMGWIGIFSTWYLHPLRETPQDQYALIPFSLAAYIGLQPVVGIVVVGGVIVGICFQVEI
ncbi:hypothetical protein N7492_006141 [Penicillium capsulatum]|uniref:Wax synthase domain-containing protein n=1 Tax=Penicillium capsulatum TaxID=69766 RepID=A0A9W9I387_9EURO|nr:hypothetical protein N7492_006141 [Penicillium capsulatum]KAJ6108791.1 hypothetical protein N7512_008628 [Penicillium capsulatum]